MRARWFGIGCLLLISLLALLPARALAFTGQDFTITAGAGSGWVDGGYDFHGSATATKASFRPFEGANNLTLIVWLSVPAIPASGTGVFSHRESASAQFRVYFGASGVVDAQIASADVINLVHPNSVTANKRQLIVLTWDKDLNSGKADLYLNTTKAESAGTVVNNGDADADCVIAALNDGTYKFNGTIYFLGLDYHKWSQTDVNAFFALGSEGQMGDMPDYYWLYNDNTGTTLDGNSPFWHSVEAWTLDPNANAWLTIETWTLGVHTLVFTWHAIETWIVTLLPHVWLPSPLQDPELFIFLGAAVGVTVGGTLTLGLVKRRDARGVYVWGGITFIALLVMLGVLL